MADDSNTNDIDEDNTGIDDEKLDDRIRRIIQVQDPNQKSRLSDTGVTQADRIIDRVNQLENMVSKSTVSSEQLQADLIDLSHDVEELKSSYGDVKGEIDEIEESVTDRFDSVDAQLDYISDNAGLQLPEGARRKLTLAASIALLSFSLMTGLETGISLVETKISLALGLGLIATEIFEYFK